MKDTNGSEGSARADSDLDVGYYLRDVSGAPLEVRGRVLEEGVRIYSGNEQERVYLEAGLLSRYHDYKPELEALQKIRLRRIAERGLR